MFEFISCFSFFGQHCEELTSYKGICSLFMGALRELFDFLDLLIICAIINRLFFSDLGFSLLISIFPQKYEPRYRFHLNCVL